MLALVIQFVCSYETTFFKNIIIQCLNVIKMFANASPHLLYECNSENWKINKQNNNSSTRTRPFKIDHAFPEGKKWQD